MNLNTVFRGPATIDPARLVLTTPPKVEPYTFSSPVVQQILRLDDSTQDNEFVNLCFVAARMYLERVTNLSLISQGWTLYQDEIPLRQGQYGIEYGLAPSMSRFTGSAAGREIILGRGPLISVDAFKYLDQNGTLQTWASSNFTVGNVGVETAYGRLWLNEDGDWPDVGSFPNALQITFTAGFGATVDTIPAHIRMALLQLGTYWYEHRLPINDSGLVMLPTHLEALITSCKLSFCA